MGFWDWLGLGVPVAICLWAMFKTEGNRKRCEKIEARIRKAVKQLNKELDQK